MQLKISKQHQSIIASDGKSITFDKILPEYISEIKDSEVHFQAVVQMYKNGSLFDRIYPVFIVKCPFCSLSFEAEIEIRMFERTLKYCPFCGKSIKDIIDHWKQGISVEVEE